MPKKNPLKRLTKHDPGGKSRPLWPEDSTVSVDLSKCERYRYQLREVWDPDKPLVLWLLMNPSVACLEYRDPTLRKTGTFARSWGYGGQLVGNVHAYRATDKRRLRKVRDPVGPENDQKILEMADEVETIILAYGQAANAKLRQRGPKVVALLKDHQGLCYLRLGKDANNSPWHPRSLPRDLCPIPYDARPKWVPPRGGANA